MKNTIDVLCKRRSVRSFLQTPVTDDKIKTIIQCALLAPSARNEQPIEFIVIKEKAKREKLATIAVNGPFFKDAPVVIAVIARETPYALEDGCASTTNALNAAHALGLGGCWVAGHNADYADGVEAELGISDGFKLISLVALGYEASEAKCPPKRDVSMAIRYEHF